MDWDSVSDKLSVLGDRLGRSLRSTFGSRNERVVRTLEPLVAAINEREAWAQGLAAEDFGAETERLRGVIAAGEQTLDEIIPEAFALAREFSAAS